MGVITVWCRRVSVVVAAAALFPGVSMPAAAGAGAAEREVRAAAKEIYTFASGKCVDVAKRSAESGANIQQWACNGTAGQKFRIEPVGDNRAVIKTFSDRCWDVAKAGTGDGANIQQWTCNGSAHQKFRLVHVGDRVNIRTFVDKCVGVQGAGTGNGVNIRQWKCNGSAAQKFKI
ncbi:RICIN domain-containing protein [Embleya sp. NPDC005971]|uniref:RICIN domain-containing protein n=1 Tax=Embleya sp. NPDC005971 TaxID=3156724 RepID=UPI0034094CA4